MCYATARRYFRRMTSDPSTKAVSGRPLDRVGLMSLAWAAAFLALAGALMFALR
ncbi:MAG TPA: hypothetical protein VKU90_07695 [Caulobacteraceae bacterium]|nr:hypothetical protein [Caulobacteraceae bacterium]